jgi:hypothetical protein
MENEGMQSARKSSNGMLWTGRILSTLVVLLLMFTGGFAIFKPAVSATGFAHYGYPANAMWPVVAAEIVCALLYAVPSTSVLGAILLTGYFGGATATHVRVGEPFFLPVVVAVVAWLGLYLRDSRLRALVPLRRWDSGY